MRQHWLNSKNWGWVESIESVVEGSREERETGKGDKRDCLTCSVCRGNDHHWLEDISNEDGEMILVCKHCEARKAVFEVEVEKGGEIVFANFYNNLSEGEEILLIDEVEEVLGTTDLQEAEVRLMGMDQKRLREVYRQLKQLTEESRR